MKQITILGEGAWGTALASILADNGYEPLIWGYHADSCSEINTNHTNSKFLPNSVLSTKIQATPDITKALNHSSTIFVAIPTNYIRQTLQDCTKIDHKVWIIGSKGLETSTGFLSTQILDQLFPKDQKVVIAGPSFAQDVINQQPTSLVVASNSVDARLIAINLLKNDYMSLQESNDVIGVQYASVLKNIYALGMGMLRGAGYEDNTSALYLVKALQEMQKIIKTLNGHPETVFGFAGLGDLYLTASSMKSKNMRFGFEIGSGKPLAELKQRWVSLPEGIMALEAFSKKVNTTCTLITYLEEIVKHKAPFPILLDALIS
jgi:glycerol-3-phosphate dehydrogenase (NAD(P)+)